MDVFRTRQILKVPLLHEHVTGHTQWVVWAR